MPCPSALRVFLIPCLWKATTLYIISLQAMSDGNDEEWLAACPTEPPQDVWHQECVHVHLKCNVRFVLSLTVLKLIYGNHWIYFLVFRDCWVFWNSIWPYYYFYSKENSYYQNMQDTTCMEYCIPQCIRWIWCDEWTRSYFSWFLTSPSLVLSVLFQSETSLFRLQ